MSKLVLASAAALIAMVASARADEQVWVMDNWPADIDKIPCSAWTKSGDGTWVLKGAVKVGSEVMNDIGVKGDTAAHLLDRQCGAKK